jgi:hypothetical protein
MFIRNNHRLLLCRYFKNGQPTNCSRLELLMIKFSKKSHYKTCTCGHKPGVDALYIAFIPACPTHRKFVHRIKKQRLSLTNMLIKDVALKYICVQHTLPAMQYFYTNVIYIICQYFINLIPNAFGSKCRWYQTNSTMRR